MNIFERMYAKQEYLTPGAAETVAMIAASIARGARVLDVASGKGEAACVLARDHGCDVVGLDAFDLYLRYMQRKAIERGVGNRVGLVRGNGRTLPVADGGFDAAFCIGAPSIVGLPDCPRELARVTRRGGAVIVSDIAWRTKPETALGPDWGWVAEYRQLSSDEYVAILREAGLVVDEVRVFGREAWDAYHAPMLQVAAEARTAGDDAFARQIEDGARIEQRAADAFLDYVAFRCVRL